MDQVTSGIRIVSICGSVRPDNFTAKALRLVEDELRSNFGAEVTSFDLAELSLPMPGTGDSSDAETMRNAVTAATGVVLATPEYHGSFSSVLKLAIENLGFPSVLGGKPIALLGVAAGQIGAIKSLEHLRSVCSHVGGIVLPGPVSVAGVNRMFDADGNCLDPGVEKRVRGTAIGLVNYIRDNVCPRFALEQMVRASNTAEVAASLEDSSGPTT